MKWSEILQVVVVFTSLYLQRREDGRGQVLDRVRDQGWTGRLWIKDIGGWKRENVGWRQDV